MFSISSHWIAVAEYLRSKGKSKKKMAPLEATQSISTQRTGDKYPTTSDESQASVPTALAVPHVIL